MIKVYYEKYRNNFYRKNETKTFTDLSDLKHWVFQQMKQPYGNPYAMNFPDPRKMDYKPTSIDFKPSKTDADIRIHQIESDKGIMFTDGTYTSGQKHWGYEIKRWLVDCIEFKNKPQYKFI